MKTNMIEWALTLGLIAAGVSVLAIEYASFFHAAFAPVLNALS